MPETTCEIVGLGVIAVDDMLYVDRYPAADAKVHVAGRRRQGGGNTSCALAAAARLGSRCALLGRLGKDELSMFVRDHLSPTGVDLSRILHDSESGPIYCTIVVAADTGSRAIYVDRSAIKPLLPPELRPEWFAGAKVLLVDNLHPPTILPAVRMARERGLQVVSDIETDVPELDAIRAQIDHFICSAEFAVPHTGAQGPREACRVLAQSGRHRTVAVTAGGAGCYWCGAGKSGVIHTPPHRVDPVDTTGCGDVFHGAFCHGLAQGWPIERVVPFANAAGAIKATRTGGWAAVPELEEVQQMLAANPPPGTRAKPRRPIS